ncbi:MAG: hypothetical protein KA297_04630 [Kofleriaceae bacterium]|nr:hypothetical protein [Kofleriaceae bacterium]MBP6840916.1 hypothetical protein [Kofleriaceae bacterium]
MLRFDETMAGSWTPAGGGPARPLRFTVEVRAGSLRAHLRDGLAELRGVIDADGLATQAPLTGTILIRPLDPRQRRIRYEFTFPADDGRALRFEGQKDIRWLAARRTWTTLPGALWHGPDQIGTCETRFDLAGDGVRFARSFRFW